MEIFFEARKMINLSHSITNNDINIDSGILPKNKQEKLAITGLIRDVNGSAQRLESSKKYNKITIQHFEQIDLLIRDRKTSELPSLVETAGLNESTFFGYVKSNGRYTRLGIDKKNQLSGVTTSPISFDILKLWIGNKTPNETITEQARNMKLNPKYVFRYIAKNGELTKAGEVRLRRAGLIDDANKLTSNAQIRLLDEHLESGPQESIEFEKIKTALARNLNIDMET